MESVLISGGSGMIGTSLTRLLLNKGYKVSHLTRNPGQVHLSCVEQFHWDPVNDVIDKRSLEHDYIIHLAGTNISEGRWSKKKKQLIYDSRVKSAALLTKMILESSYKIKAYISASAIGYYGAVTGIHPFTEDEKAGNDFLATVCKDWELAASDLTQAGIRTVFLRTAFVLSPNGGGLEQFKKAARFNLLTPLGNGKQFFPWIHISDLIHCYLYAIENTKMKGAYNVVADDIKTNETFVKIFCEIAKSKLILPALPEFVLRLVFGELGKVLANGSPVSNRKLKKHEFEFVYDTLKSSLTDCLKKA